MPNRDSQGNRIPIPGINLKPAWRVFSYFVVFVVVFSLSVGTILWIIYRAKSNTILFQAKDQQRSRLSASKAHVIKSIHGVVSDLKFLLGQLSTNNIEKTFQTFSTAKGIYDQIRFLDESGMEIIRVNYNAGKPMIVPKNQLQNKAHRSYFKDAIKLAKGIFSVSQLDLNMERGKVETPLNPMIRFSTPVFSKENKRSGVLVLNFKAEQILKKLSSDNLILLNRESYYFTGGRPEDHWGFMLDHKRTFKKTNPLIWQALVRDTTGQLNAEKGFFTWATIYPYESMPNAWMLEGSKYYWKLVSQQPNLKYHPSVRELRSNFYQLGFLLCILLIGLSFFLSLVIVQSQIAKEKLRQFEQLKVDQLVELNAMKSRFLGMAAHDLRNPLAIISGYVQLLGENIKGDERIMGMIDRIDSATVDMSQLIDDLLEYHTVKTGKLELQKEDVAVDSFLTECHDANILRAQNKDIRLDMDLDSNLPQISIDPARIKQAINNLIANAIIYSHPHTTIRLGSRQLDNTVEIFVSDQGQGIPENEIGNLFTEFGKTSARPTAGEKSTGLGLAITKEMVTAHDGNIFVSSKVGEGSTFSVVLPLNS